MVRLLQPSPLAVLPLLLSLLTLSPGYEVTVFGPATLSDLLLHHGSGSAAALTVASALSPSRYMSVDRSAGPDWVIQWQDDEEISEDGGAGESTARGQDDLVSGYRLPERGWPWPAGDDLRQVNSLGYPNTPPKDGLSAHRVDNLTSYITSLTARDAAIVDTGTKHDTNGTGFKEAVRDTLATIFEEMLRRPNVTEVSTEATEVTEVTSVAETGLEAPYEAGSEPFLEDQLATASTILGPSDDGSPLGPCSTCADSLQWTPMLGSSPGPGGSAKGDLGTSDSQWLVITKTADTHPIYGDPDLTAESSQDALESVNGLELGDYDSAFSSDSGWSAGDNEYRYEDQTAASSIPRAGIVSRMSRIWNGMRRRIRRLFPSWEYLTTWRTPWWYERHVRRNRNRPHRRRKRPRPSYGAPRPRPSYGAPKPKRKPQPSYGPPKSKRRPRPSYGPPKPKRKPRPSYGPPKAKPKPSYGPPKAKPKPSHGSPKSKPNSSYGPPKSKPNASYGPPKSKPNASYGPPKSKPNASYGPPKSKPKTSYGPPKSKPKASYGPPKSTSSASNGAPNSKPSSSYNTPSRPSQTYGAPRKRPSQMYGPPYNSQLPTLRGSPNRRDGTRPSEPIDVQPFPTTYTPQVSGFGAVSEAALDAHTLDPVTEVDYGTAPAETDTLDEFDHPRRPNRPHRPHRPHGPHGPHRPHRPAEHRFPSFDWLSAPFRAAYDWQMGLLGGFLRRMSTFPSLNWGVPSIRFPLLPSVLRRDERWDRTRADERGQVLQYTDWGEPDSTILQDRAGLPAGTGRSSVVDGLLSALVVLPFALFAAERAVALGEVLGNTTANLWVVDALTQEGGGQVAGAGSRLLRELEILTERCTDGLTDDAEGASRQQQEHATNITTKYLDQSEANASEDADHLAEGSGEEVADEISHQTCPSGSSTVGHLLGTYRSLSGSVAALPDDLTCRPLALCHELRARVDSPADIAAAIAVLAVQSAMSDAPVWNLLSLGASLWDATDDSSDLSCWSRAAESCSADPT
ncbi:uncharacterized protein LOC122393962 [Amphibalanus amphitrite]|uniref:uncharacterized protein LOC122385866 n=1 Tax=Amphibalanus amphitrite TaxID=1232801 RepID=UPI001C902FE4|nr:uncharacterized protein LOC122385866 [Amphibalanus amphitrite]XP_043246407.1 uncharacterized protein LOC122393962 [Amphibalanus amphitrite]